MHVPREYDFHHFRCYFKTYEELLPVVPSYVEGITSSCVEYEGLSLQLCTDYLLYILFNKPKFLLCSQSYGQIVPSSHVLVIIYSKYFNMT